MKELYSNYEMYSYQVQKDVCQLRRQMDLPCRKCRYLEKCRDNKNTLERLNRDLNNSKPRYIYK